MKQHKGAVLVTPGAAGTYMMAKLVGNKKYLNGGLDFYNRHHHTGIIKNVEKVIYLYSNPYDTILSFHSRKFMNSPFHCTYMGGDVQFLNRNLGLNLRDFLNLKYDPFLLEKHFNNYYNIAGKYYSLMMVKYESLPDHIDIVLDWLNRSECRKNFEFIPRKSKWYEQPQVIQDLLKHTWGNLMEFQTKLPPCLIVDKK